MPGFRHSVGKEAIKKLKENKLFTEKLLPDIKKGEVFFALRPGHGSFYLKGRRLFNYEEGKGFSTHNKFSFMASAKERIYLTEADLKTIKPVDNFQDAYNRIKERAALYADTEAEGVSALYKFAPRAEDFLFNVEGKNKKRYFLVDIEVVFDAAQDLANQDDDIIKKQKRHSDRIDILLYDNQDQRLLFCEAKHFSNPEIWASQDKSPKVIGQLERYDNQIAAKKDEILEAYKIAFEEYNQLMDTDLKAPKTVCPKCGLLVFGFNQEGKIILKDSLVASGILKGHACKIIGNTPAIKIYDLFEKLWREQPITHYQPIRSTIHRGTHEIGGTLIELRAGGTRLLLDAGYPLFLNGGPIDDGIAKSPEELLKQGVLPRISGLYQWDTPSFDGIIISHAHIDHYGLLQYVHPDIPVYLSAGTKTLIEVSQRFKICAPYPINARLFKMYEPFTVGSFSVKPYLMDHSAFDAAAFEIKAEGKTVIYSGDFRGHGRKPGCLSRFIKCVSKQADVLFTEGTMTSRSDEQTIAEAELESAVVEKLRDKTGVALVQLSSQNIDRLVSFFKAALRLGKTFAVDVYTANVLHDLHVLGSRIPYPSHAYENLKVFFPFALTRKIFDEIGEKYAKRFSHFRISKEEIHERQNEIVMLVRPSMQGNLERYNFSGGQFFYSMWQGYRKSAYQQAFESWLDTKGISKNYLHTSGHARVSDIRRLIDGLNSKKIVPIHTMTPDAFRGYSNKVEPQNDGVEFEI